jgi:hypothetical protein
MSRFYSLLFLSVSETGKLKFLFYEFFTHCVKLILNREFVFIAPDAGLTFEIPRWISMKFCIGFDARI